MIEQGAIHMDNAWEEQLHQKLALLETVGNTTTTMIRFAQNGNVKGLRRLARQRQVALESLVRLNAALAMNQTVGAGKASALLTQVKTREQEITLANETLMEAAYMMRKSICEDLRRLQESRKVRNVYDLQSINMAGRRINCYR